MRTLYVEFSLIFEFKCFQQLCKFQAVIEKIIDVLCSCFDCVVLLWIWVVTYKLFKNSIYSTSLDD